MARTRTPCELLLWRLDDYFVMLESLEVEVLADERASVRCSVLRSCLVLTDGFFRTLNAVLLQLIDVDETTISGDSNDALAKLI